MECNYEPYVQITGTTTFPPIRSNLFTKNCELESLFQQEKCCDKFSRDRGRRHSKGNATRQNANGGLRASGGEGRGGCSRQSTMALNEDASRAFHKRYSYLTPRAFCLSGPDGSKSLCLNRKEYEAIVERSRNKNSDCVVLCPVSRGNDQDLDDEVCLVRTPSVVESVECRCRRTRNRPKSPVGCKPSLCRSGKPERANACTTKATLARMKNDKKKNCSSCLRGSCGRPLKCPSQTYYNKIPWSISKSCNGRLPPVENPCRSSKIKNPSFGCCCCCSNTCHRMTSGCNSSKRLTDSCRSTAADSARIRPKGCCTEIPSGSQTNCHTRLPPICCSDSRRTRLRPNDLDACGGCNVYEVRPVDYAKIDRTGIYNDTAGERTFNLSAM